MESEGGGLRCGTVRAGTQLWIRAPQHGHGRGAPVAKLPPGTPLRSAPNTPRLFCLIFRGRSFRLPPPLSLSLSLSLTLYLSLPRFRFRTAQSKRRAPAEGERPPSTVSDAGSTASTASTPAANAANAKRRKVAAKPKAKQKAKTTLAEPGRKMARKIIAAKNAGQEWKAATYRPCTCVGEKCEEGCECFEGNNYCQKYCQCGPTCKNRFQGCRCLGRCETKVCPCVTALRECDPDMCSCCANPEHTKEGAECKNTVMLRGAHAQIAVGQSEVAGWGAFAKHAIAKGDFVCEYKGEIITQEEAERRGNLYDKHKLSFLFNLSTDHVIDATRKGNKARMINHSADSFNCMPLIKWVALSHAATTRTRHRYDSCPHVSFFPHSQWPPKWTLVGSPSVSHPLGAGTAPRNVGGEVRIGLFATEDIPKDTELFFDYGCACSLRSLIFVHLMRSPPRSGLRVSGLHYERTGERERDLCVARLCLGRMGCEYREVEEAKAFEEFRAVNGVANGACPGGVGAGTTRRRRSSLCRSPGSPLAAAASLPPTSHDNTPASRRRCVCTFSRRRCRRPRP